VYFKITPPVESCCVETRANFLLAIPLRNKGRPLPKITGAIPIRYSSKRKLALVSTQQLSTGGVILKYTTEEMGN
jgi:hypothetical protein